MDPDNPSLVELGQRYPGLLEKLGQTWPVRLAKDSLASLGAFGEAWRNPELVPYPGMRREDYTDIPGSAQPIDASVGKMSDLAGLVMGGVYPTAPANAVGVFGGRLAKTADLAKLGEAESLAARGAYPDDIWDKTGWFKGADEKWRFEIPDTLSHFKGTGTAAELAEKRGGTVGDVFFHPDLMKAYPEIASHRFGGRMGGPGTHGEFSRGDLLDVDAVPSIALSNHLKPDEMRSTMLHELQHAIQEQEGFARGGSPTAFASQERSVLRDAEDQIAAINEQLGRAVGTPRYGELMALRSELVKRVQDMQGPYGIGIQERAHEKYKRLAGEVEARNVQHRATMTPEELQAIPPGFSQDTQTADQIIRLTHY